MTSFKTVRISDFCATGSGGTPSRSQLDRYYEGGTIPWVKSGELRETVINSTSEYVTETALKETSIKLVPAGAILLAMYGATVGRLGILGIEATTNQAVCHIVPDQKFADTRYVFHAISYRVPNLIAMGVGGAQPNINQAIIKNLEIQLPPLAEQVRIAAILDKADALRVKRRTALAQLDSLSQSIFIEMFGDPAHNPFSFPLLPISGLVSNGRSKLVHGDENIWNLNLDQIEPNTGRLLQKVRSAPDKLGTSTFAFETGTVLYSKLRPYLNKVVVADEDGVATTELVPLKCIETLTKPAFLAYFLRSKRFVDFATETVAGAKMPRMMMDAFWSYKLPLPPLSLQDTFAEKIELIEKQRGNQLQSATEFNNLFASLQHRAFRGEL